FSSNATNLVPGDTNAAKDIFLRDQMTGLVERLSVDSFGGQGNALVYYYSTISPDGRFIAYASTASNLVPDDTNTGFDVFLRDRNPPGYISRCEPGVGIVMAW